LSPHEIQDPEPKIDQDACDYAILPQCNVGHDLLNRIYQSLSDLNILRERIEPSTDGGCIALAAINYNIDITRSSNPILEYKALKKCGRIDYKPVDPWMIYWYNRNTLLFDLTFTFNPLFSVHYYNQACLRIMVQNEGYSQREISQGDPYELLQLAHVSETFYQGEMPNIKSNETPIDLDTVDDVPYGQLLSYGQMASHLNIISVSELINLFTNNQNFSTPFEPDTVFSPVSINKLKLILQNPYGPNPTKQMTYDTIQLRTRLLNIITDIEVLSRNTDAPTRSLLLSYQSSDSSTKHLISTLLTNLLHLGMYMRGWSGSGEYPVSSAEVTSPRETEVSINVTRAIATYESVKSTLGSIGTQINNLPLLIYKDNEYQVSTEHSNGFTIGDRINIVKQGDQTNNIASCIRLSSNWICASAHKYIIAIGHPPPFDIFYLRHIS
jgi:hypothetical protein